MLDKLAELKDKSEGTIFADVVNSQVEKYKQQKQKEIKRTHINNKWIEQADELFHLFKQICEEYTPQIEPFVSRVDFKDSREDEGMVRFTISNFNDEPHSLHCVDLHSLEEYQKLENDSFLDSLDEEKEEGGVQFFFDPEEKATKVNHSQIFTDDKPIEALKVAVNPLILELFKQSFDIESLMQSLEEEYT